MPILDPKWSARNWTQDADDGRELRNKREWPAELRLLDDIEIEEPVKAELKHKPFEFYS